MKRQAGAARAALAREWSTYMGR